MIINELFLLIKCRSLILKLSPVIVEGKNDRALCFSGLKKKFRRTEGVHIECIAVGFLI